MFRKLIPLLAAPAMLGAQQVIADPNARPISMAEAVSLAKQNNIAAITAANSVRSANNLIRSTRANLYPTLTASAGQGISAGDRVGQSGTLVPYESRWTYNSGLQSQLTLFDGGKTFSDIHARQADANAAEASQVTTQFSLALQVKTQYNAALAANEQLSAAQAQLAVAKQQLDMTVAKVNAGAANIADSLNSVVQMGNAQLAILTAQQSLRTANAGLTRLAGTDYMITANAADTVDHSMAPIDSAMVMGLAQDGPAIRQNQAQIVSAGASIKSAKTAYFPTLSMSANFQGSGAQAVYGFGNNPYPYTRGINFSVNYPIFNRFQRENQVQSAQISLANAEAALKDNKLAAQQTIITQIGLLHNAEEQVRVQQNSVRANEEALRVNQQRYTLGAGTFLEVLTSQSSLVSARQGLIQARLNYRNAKAQIEAVIGRDLP
jgi:outer membrane protein